MSLNDNMCLYKKLTEVDPSKNCLRFLAQRIYDDGYRGMQISQHNRYTVDDVIVFLEELYRIAGENKMAIRTTDLSKRPSNTPDEKNYAVFTNNVFKRMGRGTQDTIRKNHFVDFHRMGLIRRFDPDGIEYSAYDSTRRGVKYVSISADGLKLIKAKNNPFDKKFIYTKAIDKLSKGLANNLLHVVMELNDNRINIDEFMLFVSFMGCKLKDQKLPCSRSDVTEFVKEYRSMSKYQKLRVVEIVSNYCVPSNFSGNKTNKRDYGNWKNEAQQIFMLMNHTVLFEQGADPFSDTLFLKTGKDGLYNKAKLKRSKKAKDEYFSNHGVDKKNGFELHHVIPLLMARNKTEFDTLDVWQNLVYIDGFTHNVISQTGNKNISLGFKNDDVILSSVSQSLKTIICKKDDNIKYNPTNQNEMLQFNRSILDSI